MTSAPFMSLFVIAAAYRITQALASSACHRQFWEVSMIGVFVTFAYVNDFDEQALRQIAEAARPLFENMTGLRSKAFTVNTAEREANNFYVEESDQATRPYSTEEMVARLAEIYGATPRIEFVQVMARIDTAHA